MSPGGEMTENVLTNSSSKNSLIQKLRDDGSNWVLFKVKLQAFLESITDYRKHLMGRAKAPVKPVITKNTVDPDAVYQAYEVEMDAYLKCESGIKTYILAYIPETVAQRIVNAPTAHAMWEALCSIYEKQSVIMKADLLARIHEVKCPEGGDPLK